MAQRQFPSLFLSVGALVVLASTAVWAQKSDQTKPIMTGPEIARTLSGNTLVSMPGNSVTFREFHAPSGQVYGFNDGVANDHFCWRIVANQVCYTLPDDYLCYSMARDGKDLTMKLTSPGEHRVRMHRGDPGRLQEGSTTWACASPVDATASAAPK